MLVSISAVALVSPGELGEGEAPLLKVVQAGAPNLPVDQIFPLISMFAVANSALINMLMASRLLYGMANQQVLPPVLGKVLPGRRTPWVAILFTTVLAVGLLIFAGGVSQLGGTTALLLLAVFSVVNITCLVLRKDVKSHQHFRAPTVIPIIGGLCCAFLVGPWTGRNPVQYSIAGVLIAIGIGLWLITWLINRAIYSRKTYLKDPERAGRRRPGLNQGPDRRAARPSVAGARFPTTVGLQTSSASLDVRFPTTVGTSDRPRRPRAYAFRPRSPSERRAGPRRTFSDHGRLRGRLSCPTRTYGWVLPVALPGTTPSDGPGSTVPLDGRPATAG